MAIDAHDYDMKGPFKMEGLATLPSWVSGDEKRLVYALDTNKFHLGLGSAWQEIQFTGHAADHINGDPINGDRVDITYTPNYYTPSGGTVRGHLNGIDTAIPTYADTSHADTHITDGSDEVDGDKLNIDWSPSYYTPDTAPAEANDLDDLTAHLKGIDTAIGSLATGAHASDHITGQSDEIDGDKLDIDWNPTNYTVDTSPSEVTSADHLTSHMAGIDNALTGLGSGDVCGWVNFYDDGSTHIRDSHNVDSITRNGEGDYTITWTTDFANTNYAIMGNSRGYRWQYVSIVTLATGSTRIYTREAENLHEYYGWGSVGNASAVCCVIAIGEQ